MVVDIKNHIKYDIYEEQIAALTEFMKFFKLSKIVQHEQRQGHREGDRGN